MDTHTIERLASRVLRDVFSFHSFRLTQLEAIVAACQGKDTFSIMATGAGKSLCYQIPALIMPDAIVVVVSPLISLMEDQVHKMTQFGVPACMLGSSLNDSERRDTETRVAKGEYALVYVTPEKATQEGWLARLGSDLVGKSRSRIGLIAIDEAHCVSEWGHDFRPHYRLLHTLRSHSSTSTIPLMALTATATPQVRADVVAALGLRDPKVLVTSFDRENLYYECRKKGRLDELVAVVKGGTKGVSGGGNGNGNGNPTSGGTGIRSSQGDSKGWEAGSTVVYCPTRAETDEISALLTSNGVPSLAYHAGLTPKQRKETQQAFTFGRCRCVVATTAFGMGIDKEDVRHVVHWGPTKAVESYYQQTGRAGRDGLFSRCTLFYSDADFSKVQALISLDSGNSVRSPGAADPAVRAHALFGQFKMFLSSGACRRRQLLEYFGQKVQDEGKCDPECCDNCAQTARSASSGAPARPLEVDISAHAYLILLAVRDMGGYYGMRLPLDLVRGSKSKKAEEALRGRTFTWFGKGSRVPQQTLDWVFTQLQAAGHIEAKVQRREGSKLAMQLFAITTKGRHYLSKFESTGAGKIVLKEPPPANPAMPIGALSIKAPTPSWWGTEPEKKSSSSSRRDAAHDRPLTFLTTATDISAKLSPAEVELLAGLTKLTTEMAERDLGGLNPEFVFTAVTLRGIARRRPGTVEAFSRCPGVGKYKSGKYGPAFVPTIARLSENLALDLDVRLDEDAAPELESDTEAADGPSASKDVDLQKSEEFASLGALTKEYYRLWASGLELEQVAATRSVKPGTVLEHVARVLDVAGHRSTPDLIYKLWPRFKIPDRKRTIIAGAMDSLVEGSKGWDGKTLRTVFDQIGDSEKEAAANARTKKRSQPDDVQSSQSSQKSQGAQQPAKKARYLPASFAKTG